MKKHSFLYLTCLFCVLSACKAQPLPQLLDSFMRRYVAEKDFNGTVLVAKGNDVLLAKGYGYKNVAAKALADSATLYQYGSVTKQFTAALILKLQEEGKLNINDKLSRYFAQLPFADSVTLYHLLTHTSGIFNYTADAKFMNSEVTKPTTQSRIFNLFSTKPLQFVPGSNYQYSNSNYMLLGYIAAQVSGKPYESLVRQYILQPSGMTTAGFDFTHLQSANKAVGYNVIKGTQAFPAGIVDSTGSYAAGALYGSVYDLWAWHKTMQKGGFLNAASWKEMYTPAKNNYALGVIIDTVFGKQRISHGGGIYGFVSEFVRFPADDIAIIVLSNSTAKPITDVSQALAALALNEKASWPVQIKEVAVAKDVLKRYTGRYEVTPTFALTISMENEQLKAQATGQAAYPLFAEADNRFFYKVVDAQIEFDVDENGKANGLTLFQNGATIKGKKVTE